MPFVSMQKTIEKEIENNNEIQINQQTQWEIFFFKKSWDAHANFV